MILSHQYAAYEGDMALEVCMIFPVIVCFVAVGGIDMFLSRKR